jgi:peptide/nickel transport system substrate-binding protein
LVVAGISCGTGSDDAFTVVLDAEPKGLDPRFVTSDASAKLVGLVHAGLVSVDNTDGEPKLDLAASIDQPSPTTYRVTLRDDIYFHDGHPVQSEDVEYTLTTLNQDPVNSPYGAISRRIAHFEVHGPKSFTIRLDEPHAPFLTDLSMKIVPKHLCGGLGQCPKQPVGAGPFAFVRRDNGGHRLEFESFARYHGGEPPIEHLSVRVIEDDNTRLLAMLGKTVDLSQNTISPMMLPVVEDARGLRVETAESFKYTYLGFNLEHEILKHRKVRQAVAYAIDRREIIDHKFRGHARLATGLLAPGHWAYEPEVKQYKYRPDKARALLDEAGLKRPSPDEPRFRVEFKVSSGQFRKSIAQLIGHQLGRVGIKVNVRAYEWGTFYHDIKSRNFAMTTMQWPSVVEPNLYKWIFHSDNIPSPENRSAGANRGAYRNARVDELLKRGQEVTERDRRKEIYGEIQQILARDLPYVSLWHENNIAVMRRGVEDYKMTPNGRLEYLKSTRFQPEAAGGGSSRASSAAER